MNERQAANGLREARERIGMTQGQLASRALVTTGAVSQFEAGERMPSLATAIALAVALDTTVDALFGPQRVFLAEELSAEDKSHGSEKSPAAGSVGAHGVSNARDRRASDRRAGDAGSQS